MIFSLTPMIGENNQQWWWEYSSSSGVYFGDNSNDDNCTMMTIEQWTGTQPWPARGTLHLVSQGIDVKHQFCLYHQLHLVIVLLVVFIRHHRQLVLLCFNCSVVLSQAFGPATTHSTHPSAPWDPHGVPSIPLDLPNVTLDHVGAHKLPPWTNGAPRRPPWGP